MKITLHERLQNLNVVGVERFPGKPSRSEGNQTCKLKPRISCAVHLGQVNAITIFIVSQFSRLHGVAFIKLPVEKIYEVPNGLDVRKRSTGGKEMYFRAMEARLCSALEEVAS